MNVGGLAVLFLVVCAGVIGLFMIMSKANLSAPVDSAGATVSRSENLTRTNATGNVTSTTATGAATGIVLIVATMFIGSVVIYFVGARHGHKSRYQ